MANRAERAGITFDQVAEAAEALQSLGQNPTIRNVREFIGSGSPNTVLKHLNTWRESRPSAVAPELSAEIIKAITREIERANSEACADLREELGRSQTEAAELSTVGELLEVERNSLLDQVGRLTSERDRLAGRSAAQEAEIQRLSVDLERERQTAGELRIEAARAVLLAEKATEQTATIQRLTAELDQERERRIQADHNAMTYQLTLELDQERKSGEMARQRNTELLAGKSGLKAEGV